MPWGKQTGRGFYSLFFYLLGNPLGFVLSALEPGGVLARFSEPRGVAAA